MSRLRNHARTLLTGMLLLTLAASLYLNRVSARYAWKFYRDLNFTRLHPLQLADYPENVPVTVQGKTAVFYGDSRAFQWPAPDVPGYHFLNRGIGGQTSSQVQSRFTAHVAPLQPDRVLIQVGINDLKTIPLFPERQEEIIAECQENIARIVEASTAAGATVIVTTIFPTRRPSLLRSFVWSEEIDAAVEAVNEGIQEMAGEQVLVFDAYGILVGEDGRLQNAFAQDQLHLNEAGYASLNEVLIPLLP